MKKLVLGLFIFTQGFSASFTDITDEAGLGCLGCLSASFSDVDLDGNADILILTSDSKLKLYSSDGKGKFSDVTPSVFSSAKGRFTQLIDISDDGYPEAFVTGSETKLYLNDGDGNFTDITDSAQLKGVEADGAAWADYDRDGKLDLFTFSDKESRLYKNEGVFKDTTLSANLGTASAYGAAFADVDKDGCSDLLVLDGENTLYKNIGGSFTAWTKLGDNSACACGFFDLDNDLDLDGFLMNTNSITIYLNDGSGSFTQGASYPISLSLEGFSFADIDNDADLDLYLALYDRKGNIFYENDGTGSFTQSVVGAEYKGYCKSAIFSDVDSDGDTDLFVADEGKGVYPGKSKLYRNEQNDERWLKVRAKGCYIGAKIKISNGSFARFGEMRSDEFLFGLGTQTGSYTVEVIFSDGTMVKKDSLLANQVVVINSSGDVEPPDDIINFAAKGGDEEIELTWKNPPDSCFAGVKILRKKTYPLTHCDGTVVYVGTGTDFIDLNLTDETYFYTAFSFDEVPNYSKGVCGSGTPGDITPPGTVTNLTAEPGESRITLNWENPTDPDFAGIKIRRGTLTYPSSVNDGIEVYVGSGTTFVDGSLTRSIPYYYAAFSFDEATNYSLSAKVTATPTDTISPAEVTDLNLQPGDGKITLKWKNPSDPDFSGCKIQRGTETFPGTISEGVGVYIGSGTTFVDKGLTNGSSCFYSIFTFDEIPNYSFPAMASATATQDITAPSSPGTVTEEMPDIDATSSNSYWVYWEPATDTESEISEYELQERVSEGFWVPLGLFSGTKTQISGKKKDVVFYYRVRAKNSRGIWGTYSASSDGIRLVSSAKVVTGDTCSFINYTDGQGNKTTVEIPEGRFSGTVTLCIIDIPIPETDLSTASPKILKILYSSARKVMVLSSDNEELKPNGDISLCLSYNDHDSDDEEKDLEYTVYRLNDKKWEMVPGIKEVNPDTDMIKITFSSFSTSTYVVAHPSYADSGLSNVKCYPNPFIQSSGHSKITFSGLTDYAIIKIYKLNGQQVKEIEGNATNGFIEWKTDNQAGKPLASGVYIYLIEDNKGGKATGKIAIIR